MKTVGAYLAGVVALVLVSVVCLRAGRLDRDLAEAERRAVAADYGDLKSTLERAERYYGYASRVPWVGKGPLHAVQARRAALDYWERRYAALASNSADPDDPLGAVPPENVDLQFLVASAVYRQGLARAKDRATTIEALDVSIETYLAVLKNAERHDTAAYNYEYLVRVRAEMDKGRRKTAAPAEPESPHGASGAPQEQSDSSEFKVYVPLEKNERSKSDGEAGKAEPIKRKG